MSIEDVMQAKVVAGATGINVKPGRLGGFTGARAVRDTAQGLGMTFTVDDTWGGALTTAQIAHLAASSRAESLTAATCFADWIQPVIATVTPHAAPGRAMAPQGPGLGVEVHVDQLGPVVIELGERRGRRE